MISALIEALAKKGIVLTEKDFSAVPKVNNDTTGAVLPVMNEPSGVAETAPL